MKQKTRFLVDTGASVSVLNYKTFTSANKSLGSDVQPNDYRLTSASGDGLVTHGQIQAELKFGSTKVVQDFVIAEIGDCEGILGIDFLEANCCSLNLFTGVIEIHGKSIPLV